MTEPVVVGTVVLYAATALSLAFVFVLTVSELCVRAEVLVKTVARLIRRVRTTRW